MKEGSQEKKYWCICQECQGQGKKKRKISKKARLNYQLACCEFEKTNGKSKVPNSLVAGVYSCVRCNGSGLLKSDTPPKVEKEKFPHVSIIGGGIGGVALAVACFHRGIPFTLYERDENFNTRSQGYGLTLQQASKAIEGFGIFSLKDGVVSTKHIVHNPDGKVIGEWGMRKWVSPDSNLVSKRTNVHISRQSLRSVLLQQLEGSESVKWGHQFVDFEETEGDNVILKFIADGTIKFNKTNILVGADGIRSSVRRLLFGDSVDSLKYLGCMVILGICSLRDLEEIKSPLLDSATVFQTANGQERIYIMPYSVDSVMWQLSFPISEEKAKNLSLQGPKVLKEEARRKTQWHSPIPQILEATSENLISGYPVYDRTLLDPELLKCSKQVTLLGDAAHPMSPFKGQGANQALLDAISLARGISKGCNSSNWRDVEIRKNVLSVYEEEMLSRSAIKVKDSANAAKFLHSDIVLFKGDKPRGSFVNRAENTKEY